LAFDSSQLIMKARCLGAILFNFGSVLDGGNTSL
jgi:hypothetical protein